MTRHSTPCTRYEQGTTLFGNALAGGYFAAVTVDALPRRVYRDHLHIAHGYAAGIGAWYFFPALEPALAFGRAARMSVDCSGYGVYAAALEVAHCLAHGDERVLLVTGMFGVSLDRRPGEADHLARFAESVRQHPDSSHWHEVTASRTGEPTA